MKRFAYALDPLCLAACALYALNRFHLRAHADSGFLHNYFNDVLLIPAALPLALWVQRQLHLRSHDAPPQWREIALHLLAWSFAAELLAPRLFAHATADPRDVLAYAIGALLAGLFWQFPRRALA